MSVVIGGAALIVEPDDVVLLCYPETTPAIVLESCAALLNHHFPDRWLILLGADPARLRNLMRDGEIVGDMSQVEEMWTAAGARVAQVSPRRFGGAS